MLTSLSSIARLAGTCVTTDLIEALSIISARFFGALVDVRFASGTSPARMTDALVIEEIVNANAVQTGISRAEIDLLVTAFARETGRAIATEVSYEIRAISSE